MRRTFVIVRREHLLPTVLGFSDGILTALTLAAGRLTSSAQPVSFGLALRIAVAALVSGAFVFFVARYAELRGGLIHAERQLNLATHGRLAAGRLGVAVRTEAIEAATISSVAAFCGALVPLLAAAILPHHRWSSVSAALMALVLLGAGLARLLHGSLFRWSVGLACGGILLSFVGAYLKIVA
jgi:predicted membrane protein (TIGR00267 family)